MPFRIEDESVRNAAIGEEIDAIMSDDQCEESAQRVENAINRWQAAWLAVIQEELLSSCPDSH